MPGMILRYYKNKLSSPICIAFSAVVDCGPGSGRHMNGLVTTRVPFYSKCQCKLSESKIGITHDHKLNVFSYICFVPHIKRFL